jgi:hypothetical protein
MSVTENTLARLRCEQSFSLITISTPVVAIFSLLAGVVNSYPMIATQRLPFYKAIEVSGSSQACRIIVWGDTETRGYQPRTPLGERLMALRKRAIAKGIPLLDVGGIVEEVHRRRGDVA